MKPLLLPFLLILLTSYVSFANEGQIPFVQDLAEPESPISIPKIAVIGISRFYCLFLRAGAGAGGASAAYHLARLAGNIGQNVSITVYERSGYVGGRSTTVNAFGDARYPVELGM